MMHKNTAILEEAGVRIGGASFAQLQAASGLDEHSLTRAIRDLNAKGYLSARPLSDRSMAYRLTVLGQEALYAAR